MKQLVFMSILAIVGCFVRSSCDKLDDSDGSIMEEVLPGRWTFSYTFKDDVADDMQAMDVLLFPRIKKQKRYIIKYFPESCPIQYRRQHSES